MEAKDSAMRHKVGIAQHTRYGSKRYAVPTLNFMAILTFVSKASSGTRCVTQRRLRVLGLRAMGDWPARPPNPPRGLGLLSGCGPSRHRRGLRCVLSAGSD